MKTVRWALTLKPCNVPPSSTKGIRHLGLAQAWSCAGQLPAAPCIILSVSDICREGRQIPTPVCWRSRILSFWENWGLLSTLTSRGSLLPFPGTALSPTFHLGRHPLIPQGSFTRSYTLIHRSVRAPSGTCCHLQGIFLWFLSHWGGGRGGKGILPLLWKT